MSDKQIIKKVIKWLNLNIKAKYLTTDLITDNKNLLLSIKEWKGVNYDDS